MFQDFLKANTKASSENASKSGFLKLLNIKSKNHDTAAFDVKAFSKILETKYLGLLGLDIDYYSNTNSTDTIYKIINFIDKNS
jgi:hypothetical protein